MSSATMPELVLYYFPGACSFAPHTIFNEIGAVHRTVKIKYIPQGSYPEDGSMTAEEYRQIHHSNFVPGFTIDGKPLTENPAILTYLASLAPERNLAGKTDLDRAHVISWLTYLSGTVHGWGFGALLAPQRFTDSESQHQAISQKARSKIEECYALIEKRLEGREFPVGDAETLVDYNLMVFYYTGASSEFQMSKYPNYTRVMKRMEAKESVKTTLKKEGRQPILG